MRTRWRRAALLLTCVVACAASLAGAPALAEAPGVVSPEDEARARELFENGRLLFQEGHYEEAILAWQASWDTSEHPLLLYNIASALERLERWEEARDALNRYRAYAPADEREALEARIFALERRMEMSAVLGVSEGGDGDSDSEGDVTADASGDATDGDAIADASGTATSGGAPVVRTGPSRAVPITLFAVGAGGAVTGLVFALRADAARAEALTMCTGEGPYTCDAGAEPWLRQDRVSAIVADVGFVVGIAGAIGGATSWRMMSARSETSSQSLSQSLSVSGAPGGLVVSGRF